MKQKSILKSAFWLIIIGLLYLFYQPLSYKALSLSLEIKSTFIHQKEAFYAMIESHFDQKEQIERLTKEVAELEPKASLSVAFASKLNHLLKESNLTAYTPNLHLVQTLGYETMQNRERLWIEFPGFNKEKNYGIISHGFTAGIIRAKKNKPLAILQTDKESIFSVYIGEKHIPGICFGNGQNLRIKYIPNYEELHINEEVLTSGNDGIFYEGIKVGYINSIEKKDMYKIATVIPYNTVLKLDFFYAVEVK